VNAAACSSPIPCFSANPFRPRRWRPPGGRLAAAGVLKGKKCSCYPAVGPDVQLSGGQYVDIAVDQAFREGNLVTAPAWPAHPQWIALFLEALGTKITL